MKKIVAEKKWTGVREACPMSIGRQKLDNLL